MAFETNYNVGGIIDEVKKVRAIMGGIIDEVKQIDNILGGTLDEIKTVDLVKTMEILKELTLVQTINEVKVVDEIKVIDEINDIKGGTLDLIKNLQIVDEVKNIGHIAGFPKYSKPFNTMVKIDIPALAGDYIGEYDIPDEEVEIFSLTVTCSGYGESDNYDIFLDEDKWFDKWYLSEVKEGLFIGTSTFVYVVPANSKLKIVFHNDSGSAKTLWFGIRMLKAPLLT